MSTWGAPTTGGTTVPGVTNTTGQVGTGFLGQGATQIIEHQPLVEKEVLVEHPVEVRREHHIQPVIHEREHQIQPIIKTQVTTEQRVVETQRDVLLPPVVEQPLRASAEPLPLRTDREAVPTVTTTTTTGATTTGAPMGRRASIGQKIKGTLKQVQGTLTHNPAKKEEGRLLKQGIQPTKHSLA